MLLVIVIVIVPGRAEPQCLPVMLGHPAHPAAVTAQVCQWSARLTPASIDATIWWAGGRPAVQQLSLAIILILYPTYSSIRNTTYESHHTEQQTRRIFFFLFPPVFIHQGRSGLHFETLFINDSFSILFLAKLQQREFCYSY